MFQGLNITSRIPKSRLNAIINRIIALAIGITLLIIGSLFLTSINNNERYYKSLVTNGNKVVATITDIKTSSMGKSKSTGVRTYYELKTYTYKVNDTEYKVERKDRLDKTKSAKGSTANVFYDKANPAKSVVEIPEGKSENRFLSFAFIGIGLVLTIVGIRGLRNHRYL